MITWATCVQMGSDVKVADFGLSRVKDSTHVMSKVRRSPTNRLISFECWKPTQTHEDSRLLCFSRLMMSPLRVRLRSHSLTRVCCFTYVQVGTPRWTAPEVLASRPYTERADVYSFGIVVWEMVTGEVPFQGMKSFDAAQAVVKSGLRYAQWVVVAVYGSGVIAPAGVCSRLPSSPPLLGLDLPDDVWGEAPV